MWMDDVRRASQNRWPEILQIVAGLNKAQTTPTKAGMPCPNCGGTDRYEFKKVEDGFYLCRGCGAGDGWSMVMKMLGVDFRLAAEQVARHLGIDGPETDAGYQTTPKPKQPDNVVQYHTVANKAQAIWAQSTKDPVAHPYLLSKCLPPLKLRQYKDSLVSPLYDQNFNLVNLQFIKPDKSKFFLKNGQTKGCFQWWGPMSWSVFVCEGVADAISTFLYHHQTRLTISAYSAGNIKEIGCFLRQQLPGHRLVLVLDNDKPTDKRKWRPGVACLNAHQYFNDILLPPEGMDASDLWMNSHV